MITVMIVDDHLMVRDGLKVFLSVYDDIEVIGEAENGAEAIHLYRQLRPDVVLMDMVMPEMDGPAAINAMRERGWPVQVIALTSFDEKALVQQAVEAGALGFLHKDVHADRLAAAIRNAARGQGTLDDASAQALIEGAQQRESVGQDLTPRELEVLGLLVQGKTNRELSQELTISEATVRLHVSNILSKLEVGNRTEAVSVALQNGLI